MAELIGTFIMVFIGTGSIMIDSIYNEIGNIGIGLSFGLSVMSVVYAVGSVSGAHINPAVSIAFWLDKKLITKDLIPYMFFQIVGGILASTLLFFLLPESKTMGETLVKCRDWKVVFFLEFIITFILMFVILQVSDKSRNLDRFSGIAIGGVVAFAAIFVGPISGASMNPARSIAPAILINDFSYLWIYIVSPIVGAVLSVFVYKIIQTRK
ncbi:MIP family channel protein [Flavobacteriales bacterium]|nr:MIP family channel protein [Flavobacteriales bacterium]